MSERYQPLKIEAAWHQAWDEADVFRVDESTDKPKYYLLEMFPYPSGRIHMGHVRNYTIGDVVARFKRMTGFNVLHPMGWDAFGMPAENAAIAAGTHPAEWTYANIDSMREQLKRLGFSYDWKRELATCDPKYYKWEQMVFLQLLDKGQAYRKKSMVNYCETCETVLANEQVEQGACWRCGENVIQREQWGWFLKITDYVDELLDYTDKMPGWPERVLTMQRNWIGKSFGSAIKFEIVDPPEGFDPLLEVFTTRPDTLFGATFMSVAAEHPLAKALAKGTEQEAAIEEFVARVANQSTEERIADGFEKEGVFTGGYCLNPVTGWKIPVYAANFVLMEYGTGAVMAVPGHDQRDYDFAIKYGLDVVEVVRADNDEDRTPTDGQPGTVWVGDGDLVNSGEFNGLRVAEGKKAITAHLAERDLGGETVSYRLRDWGISRNRYWGAPIPVIHCDQCGAVPVPVDQLPVELPITDVELTGTGGSPLEQLPEFVNVECPVCGQPARRDTDTMDTFVESSWYFDRYCCPNHDEAMFDQKAVDYWMPVDQYIGGIEHAVLHLLYSRYWTKVLRDMGSLKCDEPFTRLLTQGMVVRNLWVCPEHGPLKADKFNQPDLSKPPTCKQCGSELTPTGPREKMSKSKGNTIDPEEMINTYGSDTVRLFCLFASPPERDMDWSDEGIQGAQRFLGRIWRMIVENQDQLKAAGEVDPAALKGRLKDLWRKNHQTIQKVTEEISERWHFNTAIAAVMELVNEAYLALADEKIQSDPMFWPILKKVSESAVILLSPMVPHIADELHNRLGNQGYLLAQPWPEFDEEATKAEEMTIVLQVNGKVRANIQVPVETAKDELEKLALDHERIKKYTEGKTVRKVIVVPKKLVNVVAN